MQRGIILGILFLCTGILRAQPPRIDSMNLDESKGILFVLGDFGLSKGKVYCDSIELPVVKWSDTLVSAFIPDTGRGSAGPVVIGGRGLKSQPRLITSWVGKWWHDSTVGGSGTNSLTFSFRLDVQTLLTQEHSMLAFELQKDSHFNANFFAFQNLGHGTGWQEVIMPDPTQLPLLSQDSTGTKGFHASALFLVPER